jgi:polysaccharide export outer membrane protein
MGEFASNQPMAITDTFTLADAMAEASGVQQLSSNGSIFLIRPQGNEEPIIYWLRLDHPRAASLSTQILVRSKDIIYAGASDLAKFNRVLSNLLPGLGAARQVQDINTLQRRN